LRYRPLGKEGPDVSVIAFGAWQLGDPSYWGEDPEADPEATVRAAIDHGITLFDTAEGYADGESERVLGQCLGTERDKVLIATKVSSKNCTVAGVKRACEASLKRLGTDYLDLYQIHWPFRSEPFKTGYGETVAGVDSFEQVAGALRDLKKQGKIRHIGVSNFGPTDLSAWLEHGEAVSDQLGYNMLFRAAEYQVIPACRRAGIGVLAYMPLMQGMLSGRYDSIDAIPPNRRRTRHFSSDRDNTRHGEPGCEPLLLHTLRELKGFATAIAVPMSVVSLCWLLHQPAVASVILGARKPKQLEENLRAAELDLGPAAMAQLNELSYPLKRHMGKNADLWQSGEHARVV